MRYVIKKGQLYYKKHSVNEWTPSTQEALVVHNVNYVEAIVSKFGGEVICIDVTSD